jgi:hypothetical protein
MVCGIPRIVVDDEALSLTSVLIVVNVQILASGAGVPRSARL